MWANFAGRTAGLLGTADLIPAVASSGTSAPVEKRGTSDPIVPQPHPKGKDIMRRLLAISAAVGLLCGAIGCSSCSSCSSSSLLSGTGHPHGRCDCDNDPGYGCHWDMYLHGSDHAVPAAAPVEAIKPLPKEVMPKDDGRE
jgi:hypothetical protein